MEIKLTLARIGSSFERVRRYLEKSRDPAVRAHAALAGPFNARRIASAILRDCINRRFELNRTVIRIYEEYFHDFPLEKSEAGQIRAHFEMVAREMNDPRFTFAAKKLEQELVIESDDFIF